MSGVFSDAQSAFGEEPPRKRASTAGYWLAGLVGLLAVGGAILWFVLGLTSLWSAVNDDLARVPIPGSAVVELDKGKQSAYWEGAGRVPELDIAIRGVDGTPVDVGPHGGEVTYEVDEHIGTAVAGFTTDAAGRYEVTVRGKRGTLAVGPGVGGRIVSAVVGGIVIFFGGLLLGGVVIIVTARRRRD